MIFQSDAMIKTAIELGIEDMRKNPWLIQDMLSDFVTNAYLADKYGQKQIDACVEWLKNNQIDIYMRGRDDKDRFPCISIELGNSSEKDEMKHMADTSTENTILMPNQIGKPIPYVVKPFTVISYDMNTGSVELDPNTIGLDAVAADMILVDPATGQGFVIRDVMLDSIIIDAGISLTASRLAVVPQHQYYVARIEHTFFQETFEIGCHAHGDPQVMLWLHSIALYSILRYRESLLEANGFSQSSLSSGRPDLNSVMSNQAGDKIWSRYISLTGMVEQSWIKSPKRIIESVALREKSGNGYIGGIKILSNLDSPDFIDKTDESWYTVEE